LRLSESDGKILKIVHSFKSTVKISFEGVFIFNKLCPRALVFFLLRFLHAKKNKKKSLNRAPF